LRSKYSLLLVAFLGTILAVFWQESNLTYLEKADPNKTEKGIIRTTDDASYVQPPMNLKNHGMWKDNSTGNSSYYQRPPGYGMLYLASSYIYPSNPYVVVKIIQILGFFLSILLVFKLITQFGLNQKWAFVATALYALLPNFSGFIYHSITEGITPVVLLWSIYEWTKLLKVNQGNSQMLSFRCFLSNGFLLLLRPQLIVFVIVFIVYLLLKRRIKLAALSLLIFVPFTVWQARVMSISGSMGMHPIYSYTNHSFYRPPHEALGNLFKVWEYKSDRFHETIGPLLTDTSEVARERALLNIPEKYRAALEPILREYQEVSALELSGILSQNLNKELDEETAFVQHADALTSKLAKENILDAFVKTPISSATELFVNSHLHLTIFQVKFRGAIWMEALRWSCLLAVLFGILALFILSIFGRNVPVLLWLICLSSVITILYLVFVQRLNEERYLTPLLPLAFIASIWLIHSLVRRVHK
jgi:hypothetical protein